MKKLLLTDQELNILLTLVTKSPIQGTLETLPASLQVLTSLALKIEKSIRDTEQDNGDTERIE